MEMRSLLLLLMEIDFIMIMIRTVEVGFSITVVVEAVFNKGEVIEMFSWWYSWHPGC